jgi:hypothetical protein
MSLIHTCQLIEQHLKRIVRSSGMRQVFEAACWVARVAVGVLCIRAGGVESRQALVEPVLPGTRLKQATDAAPWFS